MRAVAELTVPVDRRSIHAVFEAVQVDNDGYVDGRLEDGRMFFSAEGPVGEVRNTVNDLLGCIGNAMGVVAELGETDGDRERA